VLMRALFRLVILCILLPAAAFAQNTPGLKDAVEVGSGPFRWFGLKLYDARLWAERGRMPGPDWQQVPLALELTYARSLVGSKIADASVDEMKKVAVGSPAQHEAWRAAMRALFPDVTEGTRLTGLYLPGQPTRFLRDGQPIGEVADPEFGAAFFAIWLHPKTSAPKLRSALLGK